MNYLLKWLVSSQDSPPPPAYCPAGHIIGTVYRVRSRGPLREQLIHLSHHIPHPPRISLSDSAFQHCLYPILTLLHIWQYCQEEIPDFKAISRSQTHSWYFSILTSWCVCFLFCTRGDPTPRMTPCANWFLARREYGIHRMLRKASMVRTLDIETDSFEAVVRLFMLCLPTAKTALPCASALLVQRNGSIEEMRYQTESHISFLLFCICCNRSVLWGLLWSWM